MACDIKVKGTTVPEKDFLNFLEDQINTNRHPAASLPRLKYGEPGEIQGVSFEVPTQEEQDMMKQERVSPDVIMGMAAVLPESDQVLSDYIEDMRMSGAEFGIVSAANPDGMMLDEAANNKLHDAAVKWVKSKGLTPKTVINTVDGKPYKAMLVEGMSAEVAYDFINEFRQSMAHHSTAGITPSGYYPSIPNADIISPYSGSEPDGTVFSSPDGDIGFIGLGYDRTAVKPFSDYSSVPKVSMRATEKFSMSQEPSSNLDSLREYLPIVSRYIEISKAGNKSLDGVRAEVTALNPSIPLDFVDAIYNDGERGGRDYIDNLEIQLANEPAGPSSKKAVSRSKNRYMDDPRLAGLDIASEMFDYMTTPNEVTDEVVDELLKRYSVTGAAELAESNRLAPEVKVALTDKLILRFNSLAEAATTKEQKQEYYYMAKRMMSSNILYLRSLGRGIQAAAMYNKMNFEGFLYAAQKEFNKVKQQLALRYKTQIALADALMAKVRADMKDRVINMAMIEAVVAGELTDKQKLYDRKSYMKKKLKGLVSGGRGGSFSANVTFSPDEQAEWGLIKYMEGTRNREVWVREMMNDLGITKDEAENIYDGYQYNGQMSLSDLEQVRNAHTQLGTNKLLDILKLVYNDSDAAALAAQLNEEFRQKALQSIRKAKNKAYSKLKYGRVLAAYERAYEMNFSPSVDEINNEIAAEYGVTALTPEEIEQMSVIFKLADKEPPGRLQQRMIMQAYSLLHNKYKQLTVNEVFWANYYANMLSGPGTQLLNIADNALNLGMESFISGLQTVFTTDSKGIPRMTSFLKAFDGAIRGFFGNGMNDFRRVVTGEDPFYGAVPKFFEASTLEYMSKDWGDQPIEGSGATKALKAAGKKYLMAEAFVKRYVSRMLSASDAAFQAGFFGMAVNVTAANQLREAVKNGTMTESDAKKMYNIITGRTITQESYEDAEAELALAQTNKQIVIERLKEKMDNATDPAIKEDLRKQYEFANSKFKPYTSSDISARAMEIKRDRISKMTVDPDKSLTDNAYNQALIGTYMNPPQGFLGAFVGSIGNFQSKYPAVKFIMPFLNVVANVINRQLDYTPLGYARAFNINGGAIISKVAEWGSDPKYSYGGGIRERSEDADKKLYKATVGLLVFATALLSSFDADEEDEFVIFGAGPKDPDERKKFKDMGFMPYSIKIGDRVISYSFTPLNIILGIVGNIGDNRRYGNYDELEMFDRATFSINLVGSTIMASSFLKSAVDFMNFFAAGRENSNSFFEFMSRIGSTTVVSSATKTAYKAVNPMEYSSETLGEYFIRNTVVATHTLKPAIDVFGQPVSKGGVTEKGWGRFAGELTGLNRFVSEIKDVPAYRAALNANIDAAFIGKDAKFWFQDVNPDFIYEAHKIIGDATRQLLEKKGDVLASKEYQMDLTNEEYVKEVLVTEPKTKRQIKKAKGEISQSVYNVMREVAKAQIEESIEKQWINYKNDMREIGQPFIDQDIPPADFLNTKVDWDAVKKDVDTNVTKDFLYSVD